MYNEWIGPPSHLGRLKPEKPARFPPRIRREIGQALFTAQQGETDPSAKRCEVLAAALCLKSSRIK